MSDQIESCHCSMFIWPACQWNYSLWSCCGILIQTCLLLCLWSCCDSFIKWWNL